MYVPTYLAVILWVFTLFGLVCLMTRLFMGFKWRGRAKEQIQYYNIRKEPGGNHQGVCKGFYTKGRH